MSQIEEGGVIENVVISYMILSGDSFRLSRVYCVNGLGCLNVLYTASGQGLRPYESNVYIYIYIHIHM